jgi:hypothetical protein
MELTASVFSAKATSPWKLCSLYSLRHLDLRCSMVHKSKRLRRPKEWRYSAKTRASSMLRVQSRWMPPSPPISDRSSKFSHKVGTIYLYVASVLARIFCMISTKARISLPVNAFSWARFRSCAENRPVTGPAPESV